MSYKVVLQQDFCCKPLTAYSTCYFFFQFFPPHHQFHLTPHTCTLLLVCKMEFKQIIWWEYLTTIPTYIFDNSCFLWNAVLPLWYCHFTTHNTHCSFGRKYNSTLLATQFLHVRGFSDIHDYLTLRKFLDIAAQWVTFGISHYIKFFFPCTPRRKKNLKWCPSIMVIMNSIIQHTHNTSSSFSPGIVGAVLQGQ